MHGNPVAVTQAKRREHSPFKGHGAGVRAKGTVHEVRRLEDGIHHRVTIRHEDPKAAKQRKDPVMFDSYNHETTATMPADEAKKFQPGQGVHVTITPAGEGGDEDDTQVPISAHMRSKPKSATGSRKGIIRRHTR